MIIGETVLGRGERAFDYYCRIAPAWQADADLHTTEPYVYSQMVAGKEAARPGEAKNSWLTGTAAWNFHAVTEHILGVKPTFGGLCIDPCIPPGWSGFRVERQFRGAKYLIQVSNPDSVSKGVRSVFVNGEAVDCRCIPEAAPGTVNEVKVIMGRS